ncbi:MAG: hypothetical protein JW888_08580 [Pirellulales bacterium]|nr:hypothetical protein [Pirellulales bacterium]
MAKSSKKSRGRDRRRSSSVPEPVESAVKSLPMSRSAWLSQVVFRESVEAVAIAFVLAFLFRAFEAEAFVIPTGSMATTLMGRHKDVTCPKCGYPYQVGASNGVDSETGEITPGSDVIGCVCPMCHHEMDARQDRAFSGDRILVNKFVYHFEDPKRWDVTVFKYPEGAKTNFIKRLVGLPNETLRIHHGDLSVRKNGESTFSLVRKPPDKLRATLQTVHDNDYVLPEEMSSQGWPTRWQIDDVLQGWTAADDHRSFSNDGSSDSEAWLRYRHFVPNARVWEAVDQGVLPLGYRPDPQLISDFCAYNNGVDRSGNRQRGLGLHWVGDLAVSCTVDVRGSQGQMVLELVEGGQQMQCRIDVATGRAELAISGTTFRRSGATPISRPGAYRLLFANVDDQLQLWVDDTLVAFDGPTTYEPLGNTTPQPADLAPVGIATLGADLQVRHLKVLRDIYYIAVRGHEPRLLFDYRFPYEVFGNSITEETVGLFFSSPNRWPRAFSNESMPPVEFALGKDQFLMLGDNSPQSKDSRVWATVDRRLLIGKALFIYWPHSWDQVSIGGARIPFPFFPNFRRMEFVR